jgi:hypothetical protein
MSARKPIRSGTESGVIAKTRIRAQLTGITIKPRMLSASSPRKKRMAR